MTKLKIDARFANYDINSCTYLVHKRPLVVKDIRGFIDQILHTDEIYIQRLMDGRKQMFKTE